MSDENASPTSGEKTHAEAKEGKDHIPAPFEGVITQAVNRIKSEPFLFVIAIVALVIGLVVLATGLGSPDLRFLAIVIGSLTFTAILGYYILEGWKLHSTAQKQILGEPKQSTEAQGAAPGQRIVGTVKSEELSGDAQLGGVKATNEALKYEGGIRGDVDVKKATGGRAFGVEIGGEETGKRDQTDQS